MSLKQSFDRLQPKSVKDFFIPSKKHDAKPKTSDNNNFFTQLVQRSQSS